MDRMNGSQLGYGSEPKGPQVAVLSRPLPPCPRRTQAHALMEILSWISISEDPLQTAVNTINIAEDTYLIPPTPVG